MVESDIAALERVILDRGHGSAWGCQFYAELTPAEFVITRFFDPSDPTRTFLARTNLALAPKEWQQVSTATAALLPHLPPAKHRFRLFARRIFPAAADGTAYRKLTLLFRSGRKLRTISVPMPDCPEVNAFEQLLEHMVLSRYAVENKSSAGE